MYTAAVETNTDCLMYGAVICGRCVLICVFVMWQMCIDRWMRVGGVEDVHQWFDVWC